MTCTVVAPSPPPTTDTLSQRPPPPFSPHAEHYAPPAAPTPPRSVRFQVQPTTRDPEPDAQSVFSLPPYLPAKYGKFGIYDSEAEYLSALRAWVEEKSFDDPGEHGLIGFYGKKTTEDYLREPGGGFRSGEKKKKKEKRRTSAAAASGSVAEGELGTLSRQESTASSEGQRLEQAQGDAGVESGTQQQQGRRRKSSISQWLSRRRTESISEA